MLSHARDNDAPGHNCGSHLATATERGGNLDPDYVKRPSVEGVIVFSLTYIRRVVTLMEPAI
jgi:hypothetical protein